MGGRREKWNVQEEGGKEDIFKYKYILTSVVAISIKK